MVDRHDTTTPPSPSSTNAAQLTLQKIQRIKQVLPTVEYEKFELLCGLMRNKLLSKETFKQESAKILAPFKQQLAPLGEANNNNETTEDLSMNQFIQMYKNKNTEQRKILVQKYPHYVKRISEMRSRKENTVQNNQHSNPKVTQSCASEANSNKRKATDQLSDQHVNKRQKIVE